MIGFIHTITLAGHHMIKTIKMCQMGLCGTLDKYQHNNIFILNNFEYVSNNNNYKQRLPHITVGDIIILEYNSNINELSFFKSNDLLLNSKIINLPKNKTFYWMVGHKYKPMSMTIL